MPRTSPIATLGLLISLAACATTTRSTATALAIDGPRIYLVDGHQLRVLDDDGHALRPLPPLSLPCTDPLDIELHHGALHLLCADGRVFAGRPDAWHLRLPALTGGHATALQRADGQLVQITRHDPPPPRGITLDGPTPHYAGRLITDEYSEPDERPLLDYWHGADEPSPSTADGRAFIFSIRLFRHTQLLLSLEGLCNVRCRIRGAHRTLDLAVDEPRRTFAALSSAELLLLRLDARARVRARAYDPQTGARLRRRVRCLR